MEPFEDWIKVFTRAWQNDDKEVLSKILKNAPGYLRHVSISEKGNILGILFDAKRGLLKFIESVLCMEESQIKLFGNVLAEGFGTLKFLVEFFVDDYEPYITQTRNICVCCIESCCTFEVKKASSKALKKLIELYKSYDMKLHEIITGYEEQVTKYIVIGAIARYCPKTQNMANEADSIFLKLLHELQNQRLLSSRNQQTDHLKIYLECVLDMLSNFVPCKNSPETEYLKNLYQFFLVICESDTSQEIINKTIYILNIHKQYFSRFIFEDYEKWHQILNILYQNSGTYIVLDALKIFYQIVTLYLSEEYKEDIFLYFRNYFMLNFNTANLSPTKLGLITYGLGQLSNLNTKYPSFEINEIFRMIAGRTLSFSTKKENVHKYIEILPECLQASSEIISRMPNISMHDLHIIIKLSVTLIKRFPELKLRNHINAIEAFKVCFSNIRGLEKKCQYQYFHSVFYEGILWSCSHGLFVDIILQKEIENLSEYNVCYKNYLPFWLSLLEANNYEDQFRHQFFLNLILVLNLLIDKINLSTEPKDNQYSSDASLQLQAKKEVNFRYFVNLVDLYVDIFEKMDVSLLEHQLEKLLTYFVKCSYKNTMVSGFYKFIAVIFIKTNGSYDYESRFNKCTCELIVQYLSDVIYFVEIFANELQLSCIYLIFNTPLFFIANLVNKIKPVIKMAFRIGLSNISLAFFALETLDHWINCLQSEHFTELCKDMIFYMEPYFESEENFVDMYQKVREDKNEDIKNTLILKTDKCFETLQKKILLFYGSFDYDILLEFLHCTALQTNTSWIKKNILMFDLSFEDAELEISLDKFIPKINKLIWIENRRTRFSACELLHTIITIILGKRLACQCFKKNLCFTILKLGSDSDDAIRNLYHPLTIQLCHYLSYTTMVDSKLSQEFLNALFDGLADDFNTCLRDYCGVCLKEFVQWRVKQFPKKYITNFSDFSDLADKIISYALSPLNKERTAAAIAFSNLYETFVRSLSVINYYWLHFFHAFVKSLEVCNDMRIINVLDNLVVVIKDSTNLMNAKSRHRRKPPGFSSENLRGATFWLLEQCTSPNAPCRTKRMELFETVCVLLPGYNSVKEYIEDCGVSYINSLALKNLDENFESVTTEKVKAFLTCLDFYNWLFYKKYLLPDTILLNEETQSENDLFFNYFAKFLFIITHHNLKRFTESLVNTPEESDVLLDLLNKLVLKIFQVISNILATKREDAIVEKLWSKDLNTLIYNFTLYPRQIGLTSKTLELCRPEQMQNWFVGIMKYLPKTHLHILQDKFFIHDNEDYRNFMDINSIINLKVDVFALKDFVRGITVLKKCNFIIFTNEIETRIKFFKEKVTDIFEALKTVAMMKDGMQRLETHVTDYLEDIMTLFLLEYQPQLVEHLVKLIVSGFSFAATNETTIAFHYFFKTFKTLIYNSNMLGKPSDTLGIIEETLQESPDELFLILEDLLSSMEGNRNNVNEQFANEVIKKCDKFKSLLNNVEQRKTRFFNINRIAVSLMSNPTGVIPTKSSPSAFHDWILDEFNRADNLEKKSLLIESFFICLTDASNNTSSDLTTILRKLRKGNSAAWLIILESKEVERSRAVHCLHVLLKMLLVTCSWIVFEGIIKFTAGVCKLLFEDSMREHLIRYFKTISAENELRSLNKIYRIFKSLQLTTEERLDTLNYFLVPALEFCESFAVQEFFQANARDIANLIVEKISDTDLAERKQFLVTKIGCFKLFELMYGRVPVSKINNFFLQPTESLNQVLIKETLQLRCFSTTLEDEKELARLLQCAGFNCYIALVCMRNFVDHYNMIFQELPATGQFIWEKIINCNRRYRFDRVSASFSKRTVNIDMKMEESPLSNDPPYASYLYRYDPSELYNRSPQICEQRMSLSLENDELNEHECMPMITAAIMHMYNSRMIHLPKTYENQENVPKWVICFRQAFYMDEPNVTLFLLRIMSNVQRAFVYYIKYLFEALIRALCLYLRQNPINYLIRDVLFTLTQSELLPETAADVGVAQELVELLINRAPDTHNKIYEYNVEIIESLVKLWSETLNIPNNLNEKIQTNEDLAMRILLILFKNGVGCADLIARHEVNEFVRKMMFQWQDPMAPRTFETVGWILKSIVKEQREDFFLADLVPLFSDMKRLNNKLCVHMVYLTFRGCPCLSNCEQLWPFINPRNVEDEYLKAECYDVCLKYLYEEDAQRMIYLVQTTGLEQLMRDRELPCLVAGFKIIDCLLNTLSATDGLPYAQAIEKYVSRDALLEHKRMAIGIFMNIYDKYELNDGEGSEAMMKLSRKVLINGIGDPSDEVQDELLGFWRENTGPLTTIMHRFVHLLKMFTPEVASSFSQFVCLMMLELTVTSDSLNDRTVLYKPLLMCDYDPYEIATPHHWKKRVPKAPMFAPSLASLLERTIFQQGGRVGKELVEARVRDLPAATMAYKISKWIARLRVSQKSRCIPDPSLNSLSKRFLLAYPTISEGDNSQQASMSQSTKDIDEYYEKLKKEAAEQKERVKINRRYRIGFFPDVRISQSNFVATLQDTIRRDRSFANDFLVTLVCSLIASLKDEEIRGEFTNVVAEVCRKAMAQPNDFTLTAIEIMIQIACKQYDPHDVMKTAKFMDKQSLAILMLEKDSIDINEPAYSTQSKAMLTGVVSVLHHHLQLATLYRSFGDLDVVHSIFKNWVMPTNNYNLRQGCLAEAENNWLSANAHYEEACGFVDSQNKEYCLEGMFRCSSELSSWSEINKNIKNILNNNYDSIWQNPQKNELLAWLITSKLQKQLEDISIGATPESDFIKHLDDWIRNEGTAFTKQFGEQLSVFYLCSKQPSETIAIRCLRNYLDNARVQWINLSSFNEESRFRVLKKLRDVNDINIFLKTLKSKDLVNITKKLMSYWEQNSPKTEDDLLSWNLRVAYRLCFSCFLIEKFKESSINDNIINDLLSANVSHNLKLSKLAIEHKNEHLAMKFTSRIVRSFNQMKAANIPFSELQSYFDLTASQLKFLCGRDEIDARSSFWHYSSAWKLAEDLIKKENVNISTKIKAKHQVFDVTSTLYNLTQTHVELVQLAMKDTFVSKILDMQNPEQFEDNLTKYRYEILKNVCNEGNNEEMAESYTKFAQYCYEFISSRCNRDWNMHKELIFAVLTAMSLGSLNAIHYFPCLLKCSIYADNEHVKQFFVNECKKVPSWMFLHWQEQIVLHLTTSLSPLILPIVQRLVSDYPNAIMYSFRCTYDAHSELHEDPDIKAIYESLFSDSRINNYFKAMLCLYHPKHFLKHRLLELIQSDNNCEMFVEAAKSLFNKISGENVMQLGSLHKQIYEKYNTHFKRLTTASDINNAKADAKSIYDALDGSNFARRINNLLDPSLDHYSTFLYEFSTDFLEIEVPGQYIENRKPIPYYHAKIWSIDKSVEIVNDNCSCIKITMIGTNAKRYTFLVKSETDLQRDQRIQRVFEIFNDILRKDTKCHKRNLSINTFTVVPLTRSLGLIQWIDETKTLREFVEFMMQNKSTLQSIADKYQNWIEKAVDNAPARKSHIYKQALEKYSVTDVFAMMKELTSHIDWDLLVKTFQEISPSVDCFVQLRQNFVKSYASMCVVHWIIGVGDRRLEKTLVEVKTGKCYGIDFSLVFGSGIDQPIPELVPFRLTAQILGLLRPFRERDLFGATMTYILAALKNEKNLILILLDVFLHESLDWNEKLNKRLRDDKQYKGVKWLPKRKCLVIKKKLSGAKPSNIMLEELSYMHDDNEDDENHYFTLYTYIVNGNERHHKTARSSIKNDDLTPEEQVQCLLDQATDVNVLGRLWSRWCPFV